MRQQRAIYPAGKSVEARQFRQLIGGWKMEPTHNRRFIALMDHFMPNCRIYREMLNRLPVRHENWWY